MDSQVFLGMIVHVHAQAVSPPTWPGNKPRWWP